MLIYILIIIFICLFIFIFYTFTFSSDVMKNKLIEFKLNIKNTPNLIDNTIKNIAIVTLETRKLDYLDTHNDNIQNYCNLHNYKYLFYDNYNNTLELPIYWKKIQLVLELLNSNVYNYVMWLDSDTMICDPDIKIENIINLDKKSIYIGKDLISKFDNNTYNAGVFIIKNDLIGKKFLIDCINTYLNRYECLDKSSLRYKLGEWAGRCYEQGIMNELLKSEYINEFYFVEEYLFMNNSSPITTCFILHLFSGQWHDCGRYDIFKNIDNIDNSRIYQLYFKINSFNNLFFNYIKILFKKLKN